MSTSKRLAATCVAAALVAGMAFACRPEKVVSPDRVIGKGAERVDPHLLPRRVASDAKFPPTPPSWPLAIVPEKSVGPFLARHKDTAMAMYIGPGEGGARRVISLPLAADGSPFDPQIVAPTSADATMMIVRSAGGEQGAYVVAWTDLTDRGESLSVAGVTALGKARSTPVELTRTQDEIVWVEVVPTERGEIAVWVEEARSGGANLFAVPLDPDGRPRGLPSVVVRGIAGWQAVPAASGAGLAILTHKSPATKSEAPPMTTISWLQLDAEGRASGPPVAVGTSAQRVVDVDVAAVGPDFVLAWTRRGAPEPEVMVASVHADGQVVAPHSISSRSGGAALVDAAGGSRGGVLAWEETSHLVRGTRRLHIVPLAVGKLPEAPPPGMMDGAILDLDMTGVPEIVPLERGCAILARIRTCADPPIPSLPCEDPTPSPTFVRLDDHFVVTETQPIFVDASSDHASLAWGLSCQGSDCFALAAGAETPAEVRIVRLSPAPNRWHAPLPSPQPPDAPRVLAVDTLASADLYSELSVASVKGAPLVAAITTESQAKGEGLGAATVTAAPLEATGGVRGPPIVLTRRARPEGGVSVASAEGAEGAAIGWVGRENGHAAVHVTRVDGSGKRTNDVQLTSGPGDASDVALTWVGGEPAGWVVAWVDTRDGNGEVYATKVDVGLRRIAREVRVTNAPGDASDVTLLARPSKDGPVVWVAWADPRESPRDGMADIYVSRLKGLDATPVGPEQRVLATVPHSRSPSLAPGAGVGAPGVSIAWIEEAPGGADPAGVSVYGAMLGELDEKGRLIGEPLRTRGAGEGFPTSITIDRVGTPLHVALTRSTRDDIYLDAITLQPGGSVTPYVLFGLEGPPSMDVALGILGDGIYFNDQIEGSADGRVRRATVDWKH